MKVTYNKNVFKVVLSPIFRDHRKWSCDGSEANKMFQFFVCLQILLIKLWDSGSGSL
jgi:hypothetical protein